MGRSKSSSAALREDPLSPGDRERLAAVLDAYLVRARGAAYLASGEGQSAHRQLLIDRERRCRRAIAPWIDATLPLAGARVLEIGCGTGSATLSFAERGARVTAIDLDAEAIAIARLRCELAGFAPELSSANAVDFLEKCEPGGYDLIVFYACLEHMTLRERLAALRAAFDRLAHGQLLGVVETPNRLWPFDHHTAQLPFFHWLPDELALAWSAQSPRPSVRDLRRDDAPESLLAFLRRGRGVSFHEFALACGSALPPEVASSFRAFERARLPRRRRWFARWRPDFAARVSALLREQWPALPAAFAERNLDLLLRAPRGAATAR